MVRKILKKFYIVQEKDIQVNQYLRDYTLRRLNPYNPLTYLVSIGVILVGLIMFGLVGFWEQVDFRNPFKWR